MPKKTFVDTSPLVESRDFQRLWLSSTLSTLARQITVVTSLYHVWELTGSSFWVGFLGLVYAASMIVFGFLGGFWADTYNRIKILRIAAIGSVATTCVIALQLQFSDVSLAAFFLLLATHTAFLSVALPARRSLIAKWLEQPKIGAGVALHHLSFQVSTLLGPLIGGVLITAFGVSGSFLVVMVFSMLSLILTFALQMISNTQQDAGASTRFSEKLTDGMRYVRSKGVLLGAFLSDFSSVLFAMPIALFPIVNDARFDNDPQTLGLFFSSMAFGGILAGVFSSRFSQGALGKTQLYGAISWGIALALFGLLNSVALSLVCLAIAGAADTVVAIPRGTIVQLMTKDTYRGRVMNLEQIVGIAGPELGNFRAGIVASIFPVGATLFLGGAMCVAANTILFTFAHALREFRDT